MQIMDILCRIERGEMSVKEGISLINEHKSTARVSPGKGRFIKINVSDRDGRHNFTVPLFLLGFGLSAAKLGVSNSKNGKADDSAGKAVDVIGSLEKREIKLLVDELRNCRNMNIVEVHSKDSIVNISIV